MNRLESGEPREVIIYKIIRDGIYLHIEASKALSDYVSSVRDEALDDYYHLLDRSEDVLEDVYREAQMCTDGNAEEVCRYLEKYFQFAIQILEDCSVCKLTDENLTKITSDAWYALEQALDYSRKCLTKQGFRLENEKDPGDIDRSSDFCIAEPMRPHS